MLGDSSDANAVGLGVGAAGTYANPIVLGSAASSVLIANVLGNAVTLSGGVTGSNSFTVEEENGGAAGINLFRFGQQCRNDHQYLTTRIPTQPALPQFLMSVQT